MKVQLSKKMTKNKYIILVISVSIIVVIGIMMTPTIYQMKFENDITKAREAVENTNYSMACKYYEKALEMNHEMYDVEKEYIMFLFKNKIEDSLDKIKEVANTIEPEEEIIFICKNIVESDSGLVLDILENYKQTHISSKIEELIEQGSRVPILPQAQLKSGTYLKAVKFELVNWDLPFGEKIYYTVDGTEPTKNSILLEETKEIIFSNSTTIKIRGYNLLGESSDIQEYQYVIDTDADNNIRYLLDVATNKCNSSVVGESVGCCSEEAKISLETQIKKIKELLEANPTYEEIAIEVQCLKRLQNALANSVIEETDKSELITVLESALNVKSAIRNSQYKKEMIKELEKLSGLIEQAEKMKIELRVKQKAIDQLTQELNYVKNTYRDRLNDFELKKYIGYWAYTKNEGPTSIHITNIDDGKIYGEIHYQCCSTVIEGPIHGIALNNNRFKILVPPVEYVIGREWIIEFAGNQLNIIGEDGLISEVVPRVNYSRYIECVNGMCVDA